MKQHVYCEKCLEVIEEQEDLVIINEKPYHYHCYEEELEEEKKESLMKRFTTWRFINSGIIANIQVSILVVLGAVLYIYGRVLNSSADFRIWGILIMSIALIARLYGLLSYEIKAKKAGKKSRIVENKDSLMQAVKIEAIDLLKVAGVVGIIGIIFNVIAL